MKKLLLTTILGGTLSVAFAQVQINPQVGVSYQSLTQRPDGYSYKAELGWQAGLDARFGDKFFVQPGAFLGRSVTAVTYNTDIPGGAAGSVLVEDNLVRTSLKLRGLLGYRVVDTYQFDIRLMLGPSYDVLLSVDQRDGNLTWNEGDFSNGSWNIDVGVGFDMGLFTLSPNASFGLSRVFEDNPSVTDIDSKYISYGLTFGINLGNDDE
jgi:hypothetical protein